MGNEGSKITIVGEDGTLKAAQVETPKNARHGRRKSDTIFYNPDDRANSPAPSDTKSSSSTKNAKGPARSPSTNSNESRSSATSASDGKKKFSLLAKGRGETKDSPKEEAETAGTDVDGKSGTKSPSQTPQLNVQDTDTASPEEKFARHSRRSSTSSSTDADAAGPGLKAPLSVLRRHSAPTIEEAAQLAVIPGNAPRTASSTNFPKGCDKSADSSDTSNQSVHNVPTKSPQVTASLAAPAANESEQSFQSFDTPEVSLGNDSSAKKSDNHHPTVAATASIKETDPIDGYITRLLDAAKVPPESNSFTLETPEIAEICARARTIFLSQPPLLRVPAPVKVVGDTHGQFKDLVRLFELCGYPPQSSYLFLGDYVDRGKQSLETILLLFCYKIKHPEIVWILRGNHECANVNRVYGFFDECKRRCSVKVWKTFTDVFNCLPFVGIISDKIFCVHGGLSPMLRKMVDVSNIKRPTEVPDDGLLNDLLWSDPSDQTDDWQDNDRGVSVVFGKRVVEDFLNKHNLDLICRAHMVVEDGYEFFGNRNLVTIFSAPNYCGEFNNCAAVMNVNKDLVCSFEILKPANYRRGSTTK